MVRSSLVFVLAAVLGGLSPAAAQGFLGDRLAVEGVLALPLGPDQQSAPGVRISWQWAPSPLGIEASYAFRSMTDYTYEGSRERWTGPWPWYHPDGDWPFYETCHAVGLGATWSGRAAPLVTLRAAGGLLTQAVFASEAAQYYPGFQEAFLQAQGGQGVVWGCYLRAGVDLRGLSPWVLGTDLGLQVPRWDAGVGAWSVQAELRMGLRL